ncbi:MAG TPA: hypothetical protein VIB08_04010, partial [Thermoanaerobaculia bacterium]
VVAVCSTARAADPKYIVVRLDEIRVIDAGDGREGEIQWVSTAATGNRGGRPIETQQFLFPMENWYEAREDGVNATFPPGVDLATPIFAFPEEQMGDELVIAIAVADEDSSSDFVVVGHAVAAKVGTAVAGYFLGPGGGAAVDKLSGAVQEEIEKGGDKDILGTLAVTLTKTARDGSTFGMRAGEHARTFERQAGQVWFKYTVRRIAMRPNVGNWCATLKLDRIKIVDDSDDGTQGAGDVYVRGRTADGFATGETSNEVSQLDQKTFSLPANGTRDVHTGSEFLRGDEKGKVIYTNSRGGRCQGLPTFLYAEIDVFEDDRQADCSGRTCDDVLGVLPLLWNQAWMRDHAGSRKLEYNVRGDSGKVRIGLTLDLWDPGADPDAPVAGR